MIRCPNDRGRPTHLTTGRLHRVRNTIVSCNIYMKLFQHPQYFQFSGIDKTTTLIALVSPGILKVKVIYM